VEQFAQLGDPWAESLIYEAKTPMEALEKLLVCDGQKTRANRMPIFNKELLECAIAVHDHPTKGCVIQVIYINKLYFKPAFNLEPRRHTSISDKISEGLDVVLRRSTVDLSNLGENTSQQDKSELINKLNRSIKATAKAQSKQSSELISTKAMRRVNSVQRAPTRPTFNLNPGIL
jgi:hypothetical protein